MEFIKRDPKIILIAGKARSGKNTIAEEIKNEVVKNNKKVVISPYTKHLKKYIEEITGMSYNEDNKRRDYLQKISKEIIKDKLGMTDFFIRRQLEDIKIYSYFMDVIIIPDVRFPNEIEEIKKRYPNTISIHVTRTNYISDLTKEEKNDITEVALDNYYDYDYSIVNDDIEVLKEDVLKIIRGGLQ